MLKIFKSNSYLLVIFPIFIGFHFVYGLQILSPTNINWLMSAYHDWGQHYLGWAFFREENWTFPLGNIQNFNYPAGTNVGYTDSIPILAIFFKLFSFLLPDTFQYYGIWLLSCHLLLAYFSIKIFKRYSVNAIFIFIFTLLITFNPVLVYRCMHPALCAHWLILASLYYYLNAEDQFTIKKSLNRQSLLIVLSSLINPYLFFIVAGFGLILSIKAYFLKKEISIKEFILYLVIPIVFVLIGWFIVGMISFKSNVDMEVTNSYGLYSFNLNSFWNPDGFSNILPGLNKVSPYQYEGYGYLGLGLMVFILLSFVFAFSKFNKTNFRKKSYVILGILAIGYFLFSITNIVTYGKYNVFSFYLPEVVKKLGGVFRASGRFAWVLYYIMIFWAMGVFSSLKLSKSIKITILIVVTIGQFIDTSPILFKRSLSHGDYEISKFSESKWLELTSGFNKIISYKPFDNHLGYNMSYQDLCFIALKNSLPITCGYVARETSKQNKEYLDYLDLNLSRGIIDNKAIYITTPNEIENFYYALERNKMGVRYKDGFYFLFDKENNSETKITKSQEEVEIIEQLYQDIQKKHFKKFLDIPPIFNKTKEIKSVLDKSQEGDKVLQYSGWAFLKNKNQNSKDSIYFVLSSKKNTYLYKTRINKRPDLVSTFKNNQLINSGFSVTIFKEDLNIDNYKLGIGIKNENNEYIFEYLEEPPFNLKSSLPPLEIDSIPAANGDIINNVEKIEEYEEYYIVEGWAAVEGKDASNSEISILLKGKKGKNYLLNPIMNIRQDVTKFFSKNNEVNYDNSGFKVKIEKKYLDKGEYTIGLLISQINTKYCLFLDKKLKN